MDTSTFTHFARAGHHWILGALAPQRIVLIPSQVNEEIEKGRERHPGIPALRATEWAQITTLDDDEVITLLQVKAALGGSEHQHLGECAVIACAHRRQLTAILDDKAAVAQTTLWNVTTHDSLWIAIEAYVSLFHRDPECLARVIDDLLATGMRLPVEPGDNFVARAYEIGLLP